MRVILGNILFLLLLIPCFITMIILILCVVFHACCEATIQSIIQNENWLKVYNKEIEKGNY